MYKKGFNLIIRILLLIYLSLSNEIIANEWQRIGLDIQNSVVQVWSQASKFNWLEPYKAPEQYRGAGTAFFINDKGELLTNFHVVDEANYVYILVQACGKTLYEAKIKGVCPEQDVALLELTKESLETLNQQLGTIPYLKLGDSDTIRPTEPVLALGYPLGFRYLKNTTGVIAGLESLNGMSYFHMTAPINPGNSGGPLFNRNGHVIGINTAGIPGSQNICYIIPITDVKNILDSLYELPLIRKPGLDIRLNYASAEHIRSLGNPYPGGAYVNKVLKGSFAEKMGIKAGDMLYKIIWNDAVYDLDQYGDVKVDWGIAEKVSWRELVNRFKMGDKVGLDIYRNGEYVKLEATLTEPTKYPSRYIFRSFEPQEIDYEVIGGAVFMQLRQNHLLAFPEKARYKIEKYFYNPLKEVVVITHIHNGSQLNKAQCFSPADIVNKINGKKIKNLKELREALMLSVNTGFISLSTKEGSSTVLSLDKVLYEEAFLSREFGYPLTETVKKLIESKKDKLDN